MSEKNIIIPDHLVPLHDPSWALWRTAGLRGAGFPASLALTLASSNCARKADLALKAEREREGMKKALRNMIIESIDEIAQQGEGRTSSKRKLFRRLLSCLNKNRPLPRVEDARLGPAIEDIRSAAEGLDRARKAYLQSFLAADEQTSETIREIAGRDPFQQALIWQNKQVYSKVLIPLLDENKRLKRRRKMKAEAAVAKYIQRYCMKNDTIAFFGPVGWAGLGPEKDSFRAEPGRELVAGCSTFLESWAVDALAGTFAEDGALLPWLTPQPMPFARIENRALHLPFAPPLPLSPSHLITLQGCDGQTTAKALAQGLMKNPYGGFQSEGEIYAALRELCSQRRLTWTLALPLELESEKTLRYLLEAIGDKELRDSAIARLDRLESAKEKVSGAADTDALNAAMEELERTFTELTGKAHTRKEGQTYGARTLVYQDCRRDFTLEIGREVLESLQGPLSLVLEGARWLTREAADIYRDRFDRVYEKLAGQLRSPQVDLGSFWLMGCWLFFSEDPEFLSPLAEEFHKRWLRVLDLPAGRGRVEYASDQLRSGVAEVFGSSGPGWRGACFHSPDIMIAAESPEAIRKGHYQFVMGEFHLLNNSIGTPVFLSQHPSPEELFRAVESDTPSPSVSVVTPKEWKYTGRTWQALRPRDSFELLLSPGVVGSSPSQTLRSGDLLIERSDGDLIARTRDGRLRFDLFELFNHGISVSMTNIYKILPPERHTPRITIDRMVISRESWRFYAGEITAAFEKDRAERFLAVRRWAQEHDLPRFVFMTTPVEMKPWYIDFDSPVYVDMFSKAVGQAERAEMENRMVRITEMLPAPDQLWLCDSDGNRYTSELRVVAVDMSGLSSG